MANGPDAIPVGIQKEGSGKVAPLVAIVPNKCLEQGEIIGDWRKANVTTIYMKVNKYSPSYYRPGSLTPQSMYSSVTPATI